MKIHYNLDEQLYHSGEEISSSSIKTLLKSPFEFWHNSWLNPARESLDSEALRIGRAAHCLLFEPVQFADRFDVVPARVQYKGDKTPIREVQYDNINFMLQYLINVFNYGGLISNGIAELSCFFQLDGLPLRCRFDYIQIIKRNGKHVARIVDYKTIANADDWKIHRSFLDFGYDIQAYLYKLALEMAIAKRKAGEDIEIICEDPKKQQFIKSIISCDSVEFVFLFQQKESPFTAVAYKPDENLLSNAKIYIDSALVIYKAYYAKYGAEPWAEQPTIKPLCIEDFGGQYDFVHDRRMHIANIVNAAQKAAEQAGQTIEQLIGKERGY